MKAVLYCYGNLELSNKYLLVKHFITEMIMDNKRIGLWMYQNCGGDVIEQKIISRLREHDIEAIARLDLSQGYAFNGQIYCHGVTMDSLDLFFTYNAGQQTPYQVYLYQTLSEIIPTINNYKAFALTEDKFRTNDLLSRNGITTPDHIVCNKNNIETLKEHLNFWGGKAICKPVDGWGGRGIIKLESERDIDLIAPYIANQSHPQFYIERVIENDFTDYRVDIVDGQFVACYGRKAAQGQWKTNVTSGGSVILREANDAIVNLALEAARITGLEIAGVDIIYDREHERYVVVEVNGIPAFATPEQEAFGLNFNDKKIEKLTDLIVRTVYEKSVSTPTSTILMQGAQYDTAE